MVRRARRLALSRGLGHADVWDAAGSRPAYRGNDDAAAREIDPRSGARPDLRRDPRVELENRGNLAPAFFDQIIRKYEGTRLGRQELEAELLEDTPGALWSHASIEASRLRSAPQMTRIVVASSAVTSGDEADETGIVMAGKDKNGHGYVLADISGRYPPIEWARLAITAYGTHGPTASSPRSTMAATWSGRRFAWSTPTWRLPRPARRAARSCGPNRWRRSTSRAASITSARSRIRRPDDKFYIGYRPGRGGVFAGPR